MFSLPKNQIDYYGGRKEKKGKTSFREGTSIRKDAVKG
jgi:hypothetical protein